MRERIEELENWFPSGTAEGEKAILEQVFVYVEELKRVLAPKPGNPYLLVGPKGSGKSAIIDFASRIAEASDIPVVRLQPDQLKTSILSESDSMGDMKRHFLELLVGAISDELVRKQAVILPGDMLTLYSESISKGHRTPGIIAKFYAMLPEIAKKGADVDLGPLLPSIESKTLKEVRSAIKRRLVNDKLYLFIDDTDQVANPEKKGHLNRVWALILALRELCSDVKEVCAIITLRTEVWERLRREEALQRDQTDHFQNLVINVSSSRQHVAEIIRVRLEKARQRLGLEGEAYSIFFEGVGARAPHSKEFRSWEDLITVRSRERPRDAIQLVASMASTVLARPSDTRIDEAAFQAVMPNFSKGRAELFAQEVALELSNALQILESFGLLYSDDGGFRFKAETIRDHLRSLPDRFAINLHGRVIHGNVDAEIFSLWRFLHQCDVLNARVSDNREPDGYRHLAPSERPDFVSQANWNNVQATLWEVNPAFRDYLINYQEEKIAQTGLPLKREARKNRARRRR